MPVETYRKKLIEVALPLDDINSASAREKSIRHGHPSTLHLWWARRPLAAARAVIFAQLVDDPSACPELYPTHSEQEKERERLFRIIKALVKWENTNNETVLQAAREEIWRSWRRTCEDNSDHPRASELFDPDKLPSFHDPFAGGGALPLEAQRLGLAAHASDLNPVAVLICKAMIEIPPRFAGRPPANPDWRGKSREKRTLMTWSGAEGLSEDVRYYGKWIRDEAYKRIGYLYPKIIVTAEMAKERPDLKQYVGRKLTVIAWLWARTVKSPNPAFSDVHVPLASTFLLSTRKGKEAYLDPVVKGRNYRFVVKMGVPSDKKAAKAGTKLSRGANFRCLMSESPIAGNYIKAEGKANRMGARLLAIVVQGDRRRVYLAPTQAQEGLNKLAEPEWMPPNELIGKCRDQLPLYGMNRFVDLFTARQLVALTTFSDLVAEAMELVKCDAANAGLLDDGRLLGDGGSGTNAYAEAVGVYLAMALNRMANTICTIARWTPGREQTVTAFARQAIPMTWDFPDVNPFAGAAGDYGVSVNGVIKGMTSATKPNGFATQQDATLQSISFDKIVSTDPPYYDNICYADLSDFFYVWLRRPLRPIFPDLFATLAVPKTDEMIASPYRHGGKSEAETFFLNGMTRAMKGLAEQTHPGFPVTIYYAFKQSETKGNAGTASTGWETFLAAVIQSGFSVTGTWPMRTELSNRMIGARANALASSIVLVCRKRSQNAPLGTRRDFSSALKRELPKAIRRLQAENIAPVDLAQAAIGPGMAVFTRYAQVLEADGAAMPVRQALIEINRVLDETLAEREGDMDADTRFCIGWYEQYGTSMRAYGEAEVLFTAKNTSFDGLRQAGVIAGGEGKVRLKRREELDPNWDPAADNRIADWECVQHLVRAMNAETGGGVTEAARLVTAMGPRRSENARALAYKLFTISERKGWAEEALVYNILVASWPQIQDAAVKLADSGVQSELLL